MKFNERHFFIKMLIFKNIQFLNVVIILYMVKFNNGNLVEISSISRVSKNNDLKSNHSNEESSKDKLVIHSNASQQNFNSYQK